MVVSTMLVVFSYNYDMAEERIINQLDTAIVEDLVVEFDDDTNSLQTKVNSNSSLSSSSS